MFDMGGVSLSIFVLLFSANNCLTWAKLQPSNNHQLARSEQLTIAPKTKRTISNEHSLATNLVHQMPANGAIVGLPEFNDLGKKEVHENVKAIIVTKKIPVPYAVHVEKKIPYPVRVPIRRPYTVFVPRPYLVELTKPYPFAVKVPVPQPYTLEKHIPYPVKIPYDKPYPVHIAKPYPVYVEKKVPVAIEKQIPFPIKIPVERPYPVHIPIEKPVPYPVEKPVAVPIKIPVERPISVSVEKPISLSIEHSSLIGNTQLSELIPENNIFSNSENDVKASYSNFHPSSYDPVSPSITVQETHKPVESTVQQSYTLGTIHVPESLPTPQAQRWNLSETDWQPRHHYIYANSFKTEQFVPKPTYRYIIPEHLMRSLGIENAGPINETPVLKQSQGVQYEPVKFETYQHEAQEAAVQESNQQQIFQQHLQQEGVAQYQLSNKIGSKLGNYQFFNLQPQDSSKRLSSPESEISYQKYGAAPPQQNIEMKWIPQNLPYNKPQTEINNQQEMPPYSYKFSEMVPSQAPVKKIQEHLDQNQQQDYKFLPSAQALYMAQPTYQDTIHRKGNEQQTYPEEMQQTYSELNQQAYPKHSLQTYSERSQQTYPEHTLSNYKDRTQQTYPERSQPTFPEQTQQPYTHFPIESSTINYGSNLNKVQHKRDEFRAQQSDSSTREQNVEIHHFSTKPANKLAKSKKIHSAVTEQTTTVSHQTTLPATTRPIELTSATTAARPTQRQRDINYGQKQTTSMADNSSSNSDVSYSDNLRNFTRKTRRKNATKRRSQQKENAQETGKSHIN